MKNLYQNKKHVYNVTTNAKILDIYGEKISIKENIDRILKKEEHPSNPDYWTKKGKGKIFNILKISKHGHVIRYSEFDSNLNCTFFYTKEYN